MKSLPPRRARRDRRCRTRRSRCGASAWARKHPDAALGATEVHVDPSAGHYINARTMELFRQWGIDQQVYDRRLAAGAVTGLWLGHSDSPAKSWGASS